jgi:isopentenyl-diphosphate delta-isomerase
MLSALPENPVPPTMQFLGKTLGVPLWVSSMTGGTALARTINHNLARACGEFGMGMGLGSCRALLYSDETLPDFDVRHLMGDGLPLFANLGIAQVEQLLNLGKSVLIIDMVNKLKADRLIVHVNPLQEAMQPEGDTYKQAPLDTIRQLLDVASYPVIVKEVGQGFGPQSMAALLQLPLAAVDFGAGGGTNFALLELLRADSETRAAFEPLARVGHTAAQMTAWAMDAFAGLQDKALCRQVIVSGGIADFLDGYAQISRLPVPAVYGQASAFLKHARGDYETLQGFIAQQIRGLGLAYALLKPR